MRVNLGKIGLMLVVVAGLSACTGGRPGMLNLRGDKQGPDEFSVLPSKALQSPDDLTNLPVPTPGGSNLTDPTPISDAVAALGGNPAALTGSGIPAADGALVNHALRYGVQPGVREELAAADEAVRKGRGFFPTFGNLGNARYYRIYRKDALDQEAELLRLRAFGIRTPSAPPQ
ncbi:MAG: DUF3035 domain-containing protein [Paracoccaceae bacterium]